MVANFERYDICEAHELIEAEYNVGGWLRERATNRRKRQATSCQLSRIGWNGRDLPRGFLSLTTNGQDIYRELIRRYGFQQEHTRYVCETCRELDG